VKLCCFHAHWRNISSTIMKTCPLGEHKQGFDDNVYTKGKTWQEQKLVRATLGELSQLLCETSRWGKNDFFTTWLLDDQDFACWWNWQLSSSLLSNTLKGFRA
jgi:hypothetical protein